MKGHGIRKTAVGIMMSAAAVAGVCPAYGQDELTYVDTVQRIYPVQVEGRQSVGLVLSGGGAKGIAHVGVIKALEDAGIPIDCVAGTSMGAIVGSLYACGWSPEKMFELFTSPEFLSWSQGVIPSDKTYYYIQPEPTPKWLEVNLDFKHNDSKVVQQILPSSLISPLPMNVEFLNLYGPYSKQCDENFDKLFVPFRCVSSDVYHKHKVVLSNGSLGDAVRASMSFPLVFRPIAIDSVLMYDGGIYDNFPVNVMRRDFKPDMMIGVSVSGADGKPRAGDIYSQLEDMIIQNNDYSLPADEGIKIQVPVLNFGVLQFDKAQEIYDIGYKTGLAMVDSIRSRIHGRVEPEEVAARRKAFADRTPQLSFDSISVLGATPGQERYLRFLFFGGRPHPIGLPRVTDSYYRAVTDGTLNNLIPQAQYGAEGRNNLILEAKVKRPFTVGVGGWVTSSTNSMLYLQLGYHTLSFNSLSVTLNGWVGQSYYAGLLQARFAFPSSTPSLVQFDGVLSRQKYYDSELLFYETSSPAFITEDMNFLRGSYIWALTRRFKGTASLGWGYMGDSYFPDSNGSYADRDKDKMRYYLTVLKAGIEKNTLNDKMYPSAGMELKVDLTGCYERSSYQAESKGIKTRANGFWGSVEALWRQFFDVGRNIRIGTMANGMMTLRKLRHNYTATLVHAAAFGPTPSTRNYFNEAFRSDNYLAVGVIPIWTPVSRFQLRGDFYVYSKIRELENCGAETARYGRWFNRVDFIGEVAAVYNFPFASLSVYANYLSYPSRNWNFGINFGLFFQAPRLIH